MLDDKERSAAQATSTEGERRALLFAAVFVCLLRATVVTCAAGYTFGQVVHRHTGPPLIDFLSGRGGFVVLAIVGALIWLELALLQTWPRVGLTITAFWFLAITVVGVSAARGHGVTWLVPAALFALPPLLSVLQPAAWQLQPLPWQRPLPSRIVEMAVAHGVGAVVVALVWTGPMMASALFGGVLLVLAILGWMFAAAGLMPRWILRSEPPHTGLIVAPQIAVFMAALLFVSAAVG